MTISYTNTTHPTGEQFVYTDAGKTILKVIRGERNGFPIVEVFKPKAIKPYARYKFANPANREAFIDKEVGKAFQHEETVLAKRTERAGFRHGYKVGDLLVSSWGYDQTNIEFYQVTKTTEKQVTVFEIGQIPVGVSDGYGQAGRVKPRKGDFKGGPRTMTAAPTPYEPKGRLRLNSFQYLSPTTEEKTYDWDSGH